MKPDHTDGNEDVKRLLILLLYKLGSSSEEIGIALGVDSSAVRRLFPSRKISVSWPTLSEHAKGF